MNWKQIQKKHPKAFNKLIEWLNCSVEVKIEDNELVTYVPAIPGHVVMRKDVMSMRRLYDFFDERGIYIDIDCESVIVGDHWEFTIDQKGKGHEGNEELYSTRKQAETAAFTKAFEILEKQ